MNVFSLVLLGLIVLVLNTTSASPALAALIAAPAAVGLTMQSVIDNSALVPYTSALEAALYFYKAGARIAHLLAGRHITRNELLAAQQQR